MPDATPGSIITVKLEDFIRERARALGFGAIGFACVAPSRSAQAFQEWLDKKYCADMHYLQRHAALRSDPRKLAPQARTVIVVGARYPFKQTGSAISNFARGTDYHSVLRSKLTQLAESIAGECGDENIGPICVDSDPLSEREWAVRAGIGWIGRQGSVVSPEMGCCFFLGELLVNIELEPGRELSPQCGDCDLCMKVCPAGAIMSGNVVDARRCVSYLTIEHKGSINPELAFCFSGSIFGCDRCTSVCPWNQRGKAKIMPEFYVSPDASFSLEKLSALDIIGYKKKFRKTPVERIGFERFSRNIKIVLANQIKEKNVAPPASLEAQALPQASPWRAQRTQR